MNLLLITRKVDRADGAAGFTYYWISELAKYVSHLYVICLEKGDAVGLPSNCHIFSLGKEKGRNQLREFFRFQVFAFRLVRIADGVFSHQNPEYGILIAPWCWLYRKKLIAWYAHGAVNWKLRLLNFMATRLVTSSEAGLRLPTKKRIILHQGIDTTMFVPSQKLPGTHTVVTVGRISPSKNILSIIHLVYQLHKEGLRATLKIIGRPILKRDFEYLDRAKALVKKYDLIDYISFEGTVPYQKLASIYQQADLFINVSATGSLDKAVLEAMASGVPILVSNPAYHEVQALYHQFFSSNDFKELVTKAFDLLQNPPSNDVRMKERSFVENNHSLERLMSDIVGLF